MSRLAQTSARAPGIFYGWRIVAVGVLLAAFSSGSAFYAFGLFIVPFNEEFGWTRGNVSGAISLHFLIVGLCGPFAGRIIDRFGARYLVIGGVGIAGAAYVALSMVSSLPALYATWALLAVGTALFGVVPIGVMVSQWFDRQRGLAMGIAMIGIGLGGLVFAPIIGAVIDATGWRTAAVILGALLLTIPVPFALFIIRRSPADMGLGRDGDPIPPSDTAPDPIQPRTLGSDGVATASTTMGAAIRTPAFWLISGAFFLASTATVGVLQHQASFLRDYALAPSLAALGVGVTSGIGSAGKLFFGYLADRLPVRYAALLSFGCQATGLSLLLTTQQTWAIWAYIVLFGIGMGAIVVLVPLLVAEVFGTSAFGVLFGSVNAVQGLGLALGPFAAGVVFDTWGSYTIAFQASLVLYAGAATLVFLARRPSRWSPLATRTAGRAVPNRPSMS